MAPHKDKVTWSFWKIPNQNPICDLLYGPRQSWFLSGILDLDFADLGGKREAATVFSLGVNAELGKAQEYPFITKFRMAAHWAIQNGNLSSGPDGTEILLRRKMKTNTLWIGKNILKAGMVAGVFSTLSVFAQPTPAPTTPDAPCSAEPSGAALTDTVVSSPDDSGYYSLFDGTFKGWWQSCETGHSSGNSQGAIFRLGSDNGTPAIYSMNRQPGNIGGVLMTKKKFANYEFVFDFWPDFGNDGGVFNRTNVRGDAYQTVLDYLSSGSVGGMWGEGGYQSSRDIRPWTYGNENTISIPGGANGWTSITSKLNPTSYGCPATGCIQADYLRLWDVDGWNQIKIQFYGGHAAGTGNVHMKSYFRKVGATVWVPILQDTTLSVLTPPGYIGLQVHNGNRFNGAKGSWYKNVKWRPMTDQGEVVKNPTVGVQQSAPEFKYDIKATSSALVGAIAVDYEILVQDLSGKTVESFRGTAGKINHAFKSNAQGWLSIQIKTANGVASSRVIREIR